MKQAAGWLFVPVILLGSLLAGCRTPAATAPAASPTVPSATPTAAGATPAATPTAAPQVHVSTWVSGLDTPWAIAFAPDGRAFVTERAGRIRIIRDGRLQPDPWLALDVAATGEAGLLGLALDPQFAQNHFVYVAYTYRSVEGPLVNRLERLREDPQTGKGVPDIVLLDGVAGNTDHDGGRVLFGPDGKLYWTTGDAQNPTSAQNVSGLNGKILRLNADGSVPADNPFFGSPVYSYGHRNPQGLAWQPGSGRLYETEHGPSGEKGCCQDEVNLIVPGGNYGWPVISGDETRQGMISPVIQSGTAATWAPSGATFATSGPWAGSLLFAGLRGQSLYRLTLDPNDPNKALGLQPHLPANLVSFPMAGAPAPKAGAQWLKRPVRGTETRSVPASAVVASGLEPLLTGQYGRLREVVIGPDGAFYILTSNLDGRGTPPPEGDKVLRVAVGP